MNTHKNCPKIGCGFSTEGKTEKQANARMRMHLQRQDHSAAQAYARRAEMF